MAGVPRLNLGKGGKQRIIKISSRGGLEVERLTMFTQVGALLRWNKSGALQLGIVTCLLRYEIQIIDGDQKG